MNSNCNETHIAFSAFLAMVHNWPLVLGLEV